jgi:hypothetical protein
MSASVAIRPRPARRRAGDGASADLRDTRMACIRARLAQTPPEDAQARVLLVLAHELLRSRRPPDTAVDEAEESPDSAPRTPHGVSVNQYAELVARIHDLARQHIPTRARVLVVSRGDDALLVPSHESSHYPQGPDGRYAGFHPADSEAAIAQLEELRAAGAEFLLFPTTAYWWLDYYGELARHLLTSARVVHHDGHCLIFDLENTREGAIP